MTYPNSGSIVNNQIHSGLSTQITVKVGRSTVGAIQRLQVQQNRDMHVHEEIGTDGVVEIHPKGAAKISLTIARIVFDELRITEAFARGFINIQAQRIPFDIELIDRTSSSDPLDAIVHVFHNCWFKSYSPNYQADNFIIMEDAQLVCEYVTSTRRAQNVSTGGLRGIVYEYDSIERATDSKGQRGRLDATGFTK